MSLLQTELGEISIQPTVIGEVAGIPITRAITTEILIVFVVLIFCLAINKTLSKDKHVSKFQVIVEMLYDGILDFIQKITGDRKIALRIMPIIGALFIYILLANLLTTIVPVLSSFTYNGEELFGTPTTDFNVTVSLAVAMVILSHGFSIEKYSIFGHTLKYVKLKDVVNGFKGGIGSGGISLITAFVGLLDLISEFAKIISLSLRLFGNMFAGELLLAVMMSLLAIALPVPLMFLGLLSGIIQAVVFSALSSSYVSLAVKD